MSTYDPETIREPRCPKCGGHMWNNIAIKRNPKQPDYKCKDKQCDGVIWPPRESKSNGVPQPQVKPVSTTGYESGPRIPGLDPDAFDPAKLQKLFTVYGLCLDHVLTVEVPKLDRAKIGASPESVGAMTATLLIQAGKI